MSRHSRKILSTFTHTQTDPNGSPHRMKVFDRPFFQKGREDLGRRPKSRPQARNLFNGVFWFFFAPTCTKKERRE